MAQVILETARAFAIGATVMAFGMFAAHLLIHRKILPWAASLLGQHQGGGLREHTEGL